MATKTFDELKQMAIQIRDEKTNKQNTANRIGAEMLEHLDKLEQDYYDKTTTDEELKKRDDKLTELSSNTDEKFTELEININTKIGSNVGLYNISNRNVYLEAIKFIAFVPKDEYKDNTFGIYALSAYDKQTSTTPDIVRLDLWLLNFEESQAQGKEVNAVRLQLSNSTDITRPTFSKVTGNAGTLYVIIDWVPIVNYKNEQGLYSSVVWGAKFTDPNSSNLVIVQKVQDNDTRILNWDLSVKESNVVNEFGIDSDKIISQKTVSSLLGNYNGLSFYYESRASLELKAMRIIKRLYFSSFESEAKEMGIGVLGSGNEGSNFWFGLCYLDGTSEIDSQLIFIDKISIDSLGSLGVKSFYVEKTGFGKMYVEIDFDAYRELGNVVWNWATPCCKVNNILDKDDELWNSLYDVINEELRVNSLYPINSISSGIGYIDNSNGSIVTGTWDYFVYRCTEGDSIKVDIKINGTIGSNICSVYAIYNSETEFTASTLITKGEKWEDEAESYSNDDIAIPSGAKSIVLCAKSISSLQVYNNSISSLKNEIELLRSPKNIMKVMSESTNNLKIRLAIVDARLILDDESKHVEFWTGEHTFEREEKTYTSPQRLWGCCMPEGDSMYWYWMYPNGSYIPNDGSFSFRKGSGKRIKDNIEYFEKRVTLDTYSATLYIVINWDFVPNVSSPITGNYFDNSLLSNPHDGIIQNLFLADNTLNISPTQFSDMTKLNFGVDGDSITAGNQWSYYVTQYLQFATHHNVGVGSATWACKKQTLSDIVYKTQEYDDPEFAGISSGWESTTDPVEIQKRCNNCAKVHVQKFIDEVTKGTYPEPDIFAFAMGTNDSDKTAAEAAIATGTEYPSEDMLYTLAGAMKWCIQKIHETYPNCRIFVLLPIQRYSGGNENNLQKIEIMKDVAKAFSIPVIDMYSNCGISSMLENGTGPYLRDGLHPNTQGQKLMGSYAALQIRNNYLKIE